MSDRAELLRAVLRTDPYAFLQRAFLEFEPGTPFAPNWHYEHLCHMLTRVQRGEVKRLIVNVPPRSGKSILMSVSWPMFLMGHNPAGKIICVSYAASLAREFSIARRSLALSPWYGELFPDMQLETNRPPDMRLRTSQKGQVFASGMGGGVLGRGADLIVIDDPIKGLDALSEAHRRRATEAFDNTILGRLNDKTQGAIVIVMQRLHQDDLVGHVLERSDWDVVSLPAIALEASIHPLSDARGHVHRRHPGELLHPAREPMSVLEQMRRSQGSLIFSAQYQQQPIPAEGLLIQREWLKWYHEPPSAFEHVLVSWDTASTENEHSDYSVGTVWGVDRLDFYLLDVVRGRMEGPELRRKIVEVSRRYQATVTLVEDTELGRYLFQDFRASRELRIILSQPIGDKYSRLAVQAARFEGGQVYLPHEASWLEVYLNELLSFPASKKKDQVDSTSQALHHLHWLSCASHPELAASVDQGLTVRRRPRRHPRSQT